MTKEKQSDALNLLLDETESIAICITNEDQATQNDVAQWVDDIVENIETLRKALTEHAAMKGQDHIREVTKKVEGLDEFKFMSLLQNVLKQHLQEPSAIHSKSIHHVQKQKQDSVMMLWEYASAALNNAPCLSNPPQSDNQTVLTGEDDSQNFPWHIYKGQTKTIDKFVNNIKWTQFTKAKKDKNGHFVIFLNYGDKTTGAIKCKHRSTYISALNYLKTQTGKQPITDDSQMDALEAENARLRKLISSIEGECENQMSYSEHRKKVAAMDYHTSEENHQEGRWHCANDLQKFIEQALKGQDNDTE